MNYLGIILSLALFGAINPTGNFAGAAVVAVVSTATVDPAVVDLSVDTTGPSVVDPSVDITGSSTDNPGTDDSLVDLTDSSTDDPGTDDSLVDATDAYVVDPSVVLPDTSTGDPAGAHDSLVDLTDPSTDNPSTDDSLVDTTDPSVVDPSVAISAQPSVKIIVLPARNQILYNSAVDYMFLDTDEVLSQTPKEIRFKTLRKLTIEDWGILARTSDVMVEQMKLDEQHVTTDFVIGPVTLTNEDNSTFVQFNMTGLLTLNLKGSVVLQDVRVYQFLVYVPGASTIVANDDIGLSPLNLEIEIASEIGSLRSNVKSALKDVARERTSGAYFSPAVAALKKKPIPQF